MANSNLTVANLDFSSIKSSLKTYLSGQTVLKDFDFDGSNLNVMLDVLAYNTYMNNFYLNMVAGESFLDSAQLRDSVVSHAKILNYLPGSRTSSKAVVNLNIYPDDAPESITIPKYTAFTAMVGANTYTFTTDTGVTIFADANGNYSANSVDIFEGDIITELFTVDTSNTQQRYVISNKDIDTSSLIVKVTESTTDMANSTWTKSQGIAGMTGESNNYFIEPCENEKYEIQFGDGVIGRAVKNGNVIEAKYRRSAANSADGATTFSLSDDIQGYSNVLITTSSNSTGGGVAETIESIKFNAPKSISIQDRLVTIQDYKTLLKQEFNDIEAIHVYGGDTVNPPKFGKVIISVDLKNADGISAQRQADIEEFVRNRAPLSIRPEVVNPEFLFVDVTSNVVYNPNVTVKGKEEIKSAVTTAIQTHMAGTINDFDSKLRISKLVRAIDDADPAILHNNSSILLEKVIVPVLNEKASYSLNFDNPIYREIPTGNGDTKTFVDGSAPLESTPFTYNEIQGCSIRDDGNGTLQIIQEIAGVASVIQSKVGTIDYDNGLVNITDFQVSQYIGAGIRIRCNPVSQTVSSTQNIILSYNKTPKITVTQERI